MLIKIVSSATVTSIIVYRKVVLLKHFDFKISHFSNIYLYSVFEIGKMIFSTMYLLYLPYLCIIRRVDVEVISLYHRAERSRDPFHCICII